MEDHLYLVILFGWLCVVFTRRFLHAVTLSVLFGTLLGFLVYLGTIDPAMPNDVSWATIVGVIAPIATVAIFLAWPIGVVFRRVFGTKKSTGT